MIVETRALGDGIVRRATLSHRLLRDPKLVSPMCMKGRDMEVALHLMERLQDCRPVFAIMSEAAETDLVSLDCEV